MKDTTNYLKTKMKEKYPYLGFGIIIPFHETKAKYFYENRQKIFSG